MAKTESILYLSCLSDLNYNITSLKCTTVLFVIEIYTPTLLGTPIHLQQHDA